MFNVQYLVPLSLFPYIRNSDLNFLQVCAGSQIYDCFCSMYCIGCTHCPQGVLQPSGYGAETDPQVTATQSRMC